MSVYKARAVRVALVLSLVSVAGPPARAAVPARSASTVPVPVQGGVMPVTAAPSLTPGPAHYRPVVLGHRAFPVARSNYLSFLRILNSWHAPRLRLVAGEWRLVGVHEGIDIGAETGAPVVSMTSGVIENVGWTFYSGQRVGVRGDDGAYYLYAHLSSVWSGIVVGSGVTPGRLLGRVGSTGYGSEGHRDEFPPHLHFGVQHGGEWTNPYPLLVSLYTEAVTRQGAAQRALDALAASGDTEAWRAAADRLYLGLAPPPGE